MHFALSLLDLFWTLVITGKFIRVRSSECKISILELAEAKNSKSKPSLVRIHAQKTPFKRFRQVFPTKYDGGIPLFVPPLAWQ